MFVKYANKLSYMSTAMNINHIYHKKITYIIFLPESKTIQ